MNRILAGNFIVAIPANALSFLVNLNFLYVIKLKRIFKSIPIVFFFKRFVKYDGARYRLECVLWHTAPVFVRKSEYKKQFLIDITI